MIISLNYTVQGRAYIAGANDGIVTVAGQPASRKVWLLNAQSLAIEQVITSLKNGHYMFLGLNPDKKYIVMARDFAPSASGVQRFEPSIWDYVVPANDLTIDEQQELLQSWQTN